MANKDSITSGEIAACMASYIAKAPFGFRKDTLQSARRIATR
jgi:hypothetical protein